MPRFWASSNMSGVTSVMPLSVTWKPAARSASASTPISSPAGTMVFESMTALRTLQRWLMTTSGMITESLISE